MSRVSILLDLDGTVASFTEAAIAAHGGSIPPLEVTWDFPQQLGFPKGAEGPFWERFDASFWRGLRPLEDGMLLYRMLRRQYPAADFSVCTASPRINRGESVRGKEAWVREHLAPDLDVVHTASKWRLANPAAILIDDNQSNVNEFRLAGGMAVLVPRPWNARRGECRPDGSFDVLTILNEIDCYMRSVRRTDLTGGE